MTRQYLIPTTLVTGLLFSISVSATDPDYPRIPRAKMPDYMPMYDMPYPDRGMQRFEPPPFAAFSDFPTVEELSRMVPSEPLTEDRIKKRFADRKAKLKKLLDQDRQAAVKYAQDFSKYQKQQSDNLVKLMARAEKRRTAILKNLEAQEQRILEQFRKQQGVTEPTASPKPAPAAE